MGGCQSCFCLSCLGCQVAQEATLVPLERFGKFTDFMDPGFMCTDCFTIRGEPKSLKLRITYAKYPQLRTKDNVFVTIDLAIQWQINGDPNKFPHGDNDGDEHGGGRDDNLKPNARAMTRDDLLYASIYRTQNPEQQIKDIAEQFFRIQVSATEMDNLFNLGLSITRQCQQVLNAAMNHYGYIVKKVVIRDISPEESVRRAMNDIVVSEKSRIAIYTKADAAKAVQIKNAEADAEVSRLQGEGVAKQRSALMTGIKKSVEIFDSEPAQIMSMLMMTQYTDMIKESIHHAGNVTISLSAAPTSAIQLEDQIRAYIQKAESSPMGDDEVKRKKKMKKIGDEKKRVLQVKGVNLDKENEGKINVPIVTLDEESI
jgi:regulator of protease activity HflC (stomatin/prohibitin superfamily)